MASAVVELLTHTTVDKVLTHEDPNDATVPRIGHRRQGRANHRRRRGRRRLLAVSLRGSLVALSHRTPPETGWPTCLTKLAATYMVHNNSIMVGINPFRRNRSVYQKTLYVNDFYFHGTPDHPYPLGLTFNSSESFKVPWSRPSSPVCRCGR